MKERIKEALLIWAISIGLSAVLGLIFGAIGMDEGDLFYKKWLFAAQMMLGVFFGGHMVGGLLIVFTQLNSNHAIGFGCGLYYGTFFCAALMRKFLGYDGSDEYLYLTSFIITALICYIVWIKEIKIKYKKE